MVRGEFQDLNQDPTCCCGSTGTEVSILKSPGPMIGFALVHRLDRGLEARARDQFAHEH